MTDSVYPFYINGKFLRTNTMKPYRMDGNSCLQKWQVPNQNRKIVNIYRSHMQRT